MDGVFIVWLTDQGLDQGAQWQRLSLESGAADASPLVRNNSLPRCSLLMMLVLGGG